MLFIMFRSCPLAVTRGMLVSENHIPICISHMTRFFFLPNALQQDVRNRKIMESRLSVAWKKPKKMS